MMLQNPESIYDSLVSAWPQHKGLVKDGQDYDVSIEKKKNTGRRI